MWVIKFGNDDVINGRSPKCHAHVQRGHCYVSAILCDIPSVNFAQVSRIYLLPNVTLIHCLCRFYQPVLKIEFMVLNTFDTAIDNVNLFPKGSFNLLGR